MLLLRETLRKKASAPRMVHALGTVRVLATDTFHDKTGSKRGFTRIEVEFTVGEKTFSCRDLFLFAGNKHFGDRADLYNHPAGTQVAVFYDPGRPEINALIVDQPRFGYAVIAAMTGFLFVGLAVLFLIRR